MSATGTRTVIHERHALSPDGVALAPERRTAARTVWAVTRLSIGSVFLWAFLDKLFALGFATGRLEDGSIDVMGEGAAWLNGGSPTFGFLEFGTSGPLAGFFQSFAGATWADWLFMVGLLGIGVALVLGIGMRIASISGAVLLVLMWAAALPPEHHPFMDDHLVYAMVLIGLMLVRAGDTLGLGRWWTSTSLVQRFPWLT